jgi:tetratricopeptide (TPR) repeat protein
MLTDFVDRVEDIAALEAIVDALAEGRGGALLVEGLSGIGKSSLLTHFAQQVAGESGRPGPRVALVRCLPGIGAGLAYGPVVDVLLTLREQPTSRPTRLRRVFAAAGRGAARSAPELLSTIVPGLGAVWTVGREVTEAALSSGSMPFDSLLPFQLGAAVQIVEALVSAARSGPPALVIVDDVQYMDPSSLLIVDMLLRRVASEPLALVLSRATGGTPDAQAATVDALLRRWAADGLLRRRWLSGLPGDAVAELVRRRHPVAPAGLSARLSGMTGGHPLFVSLCLDEWTPDAGAEIALPRSLAEFVEQRLRSLEERDRRLIEIAAVQGATFLSRVVAEVAGEPHDLVIERLRQTARAQRLIVAQQPPAWAQEEASDCYRFEHPALCEVVYGLQTSEQRRSRHARVAAALTAGEGSRSGLERRLEIARHLERSGPPCAQASADAHYSLARSAATDGLSFAEAERHCEIAIAAARAVPPDRDGRDRRLVEAIELLLSLTEVRWRGQHRPAGGPDIDALAAEAEQAAARCGSPALVARTALLRGKTLMATRGLEPSLEKLREAADRAEELGDPVALFVATVEYGRQVSKRDLAEGLARLLDAERMYASKPELGERNDPVMQHARNLGEMQLGVTLFDSGRLGEALARLERCARRLRGERLNAELPIALNYLAQIRIALGAGREAEEALREALALEAERGGDSGWHAYNTALLALVLSVDPDRLDAALDLAETGWSETERTWLANLVPIVRNLYAEVSIAAAAHRPELLDQAERLAVDTCVESRRSGMVRSEIAAFSLRGRISLLRGNPSAARSSALQAVRILEEVGDMPALRTEEVLFHAAEALRADGAGEAANELLERARTVVRGKADRIDDPGLRGGFLERVPLNRAILGDRPPA